MATRTAKQAKKTLQDLEQNAAAMMEELSKITSKIKDVTKEKVDEVSQDVVDQTNSQLEGLHERMQSLGIESKKIIKQIDEGVRSSPYVYILCALGLGFLLGKVLRS